MKRKRRARGIVASKAAKVAHTITRFVSMIWSVWRVFARHERVLHKMAGHLQRKHVSAVLAASLRAWARLQASLSQEMTVKRERELSLFQRERELSMVQKERELSVFLELRTRQVALLRSSAVARRVCVGWQTHVARKRYHRLLVDPPSSSRAQLFSRSRNKQTRMHA